MNPTQLHNFIDKDSLVVVDVREPDEFKRAHIPGALNIPLSAITEDVINRLQANTVVMQCNTGNRSKQACDAVAEGVGQKDVVNLEGGITEWQAAGFEVVSEGGVALPLQRQVQTVAGALVLLGVVLGYTFSPWFYLISGFVGAGLLNAGLTGWCGMANLLGKAPWNTR